MLGHVHRGQQGMIAAALRQVFAADSGAEARRVCREVIGRLEPLAPKVADLLTEAEDDLVAFYAMPAEHWSKLRSTDESVNRPAAWRVYDRGQARVTPAPKSRARGGRPCRAGCPSRAATDAPPWRHPRHPPAGTASAP